MIETILPAITALIGTTIGGLLAFLVQKKQFQHELDKLKLQNKTEFMAEETVKHFLNHKTYTDRSFDVIKKHLGGFDDDELRKILVRAGAIRDYRDDGSEWWRLLSRMDEYIEKKTSKKQLERVN
ncbi:hypothetical protein N6H18_17930 [Reichenbachiella agarivorans]|uniref:Uncharacterized protein n=1 Tax=Reichenbachiella agarivorans TaxID=2979464 RepID=A0ABY6CNW3_9BACT|nr:hypothetical protein [Reichenbachiella agarivorans]UXP32222.1 hypothetical protein N6H18_17930 [Reichenbachiella agarivorans]